MKKAFATFGFDLQDPQTNVKLEIPKSFKSTFSYKLGPNMNNLIDHADQTLYQT